MERVNKQFENPVAKTYGYTPGITQNGLFSDGFAPFYLNSVNFKESS